MLNKLNISVVAAITWLFASAGANGGVIVSLQSVTANPGSSGGFDVLLTNTGPSFKTVGAFTFGVSTTNTAIRFTDANTATVLSPYIFAGNSLFGPDLTGASSAPSLTTSDVYATPLSGVSVGAGTTFGLGRVLFTVGSGAAPGAFTVLLSPFPATSLSDPAGNDIAIGTLSNGTITVNGPSVPEPSSLLLLLSGFLLFGLREATLISRSGL